MSGCGVKMRIAGVFAYLNIFISPAQTDFWVKSGLCSFRSGLGKNLPWRPRVTRISSLAFLIPALTPQGDTLKLLNCLSGPKLFSGRILSGALSLTRCRVLGG